MSCGQIALNRLNISVNKYYASEIDKSAIKITQYNHPNTIHLGDVQKIDNNFFINKNIDLIIGGSPCTNFSFAGKRVGMTTTTKEEILTLEQYLELKKNNFSFSGQSYLFWEYIRILNILKKENKNIKFLLENVIMEEKWKNVISNTLGIKPIEINSSLVSAQNRRRLYWTNIKQTEILEDRNINLKDILEYNKDWNKANIIGRRINGYGKRKDNDKSIPIIQCIEVRNTNINKSNCLTTVEKDNVLTPLCIGRHIDVYGKKSNKKLLFRNYTLKEVCRLQTVDDLYFFDENNKLIVSNSAAKKMLGNGWTVEVIKYLMKPLLEIFK